MSGFIYVKNWDRFQHYKNRRPAWIKLHLDLQNNQEYLALTPSNRLLLQQVWMSVAEFGNGRVIADQIALRSRANLQQGNLEALNRAGFIEVRASKALAEVLAPERETEVEVEKEPLSRNLPRHAREEDQREEPALVSAFAERCIQRWIQDDLVARLNPVERALVGQAIDLDDVQIRQHMAQVEAAGNPKAYLLTIAKNITTNGAHP